MQDASLDRRSPLAGNRHAGDFSREISSLRALNRRFLDLRRTDSGLHVRLARLSAAQKDTVACCPYALFDVRLHDVAHWQARLRQTATTRVADAAARAPTALAAGGDGEVTDFLRLALFFAWHVAASSGIGGPRLAPQLVLGMHAHTIAAFALAPVSAIPELARSEAGCLSVRWRDCDRYWAALAAAAEGRDEIRLQRVRLYGIQLAAAVQLPLRA
jgi:hypothetical protein